ncbi:DUF4956 domain-containing protein [Bacillota bacterium Meth-B3]|nr:DUF4956 domain-containing protein [Christensenellaceae bacterium]MEA5065041.1 DUF4956 domain-containing protein [Eubacteriales bacterium]MEA5069193.1 DUF4956 domain-containing protein [Christensenellaceae bacterium]
MNKIDFSNMSITVSSTPTILLALGLAFAVGVFIFTVYRLNYRGVLFNVNFGLTLVLMTLITTPVVMCIRDSIQLSMGMVGALSIVRFRTAVKDPLDTAYMFWALTMGILLGAGQFFLAALASVGIAALIFLLGRFVHKGDDCYLLVIRCRPGADAQALAALNNPKLVKSQKMKSKTASRQGVEMALEVRVTRQDALIGKILSVEGVDDATLVAYQAETV